MISVFQHHRKTFSRCRFLAITSGPLKSGSYSAARTDITTVGQPTSFGLNLVKTVDKAVVLPGDSLVYTITYTNQSAGPHSSIVINDSTPAYTTYVSAICGVPLPSNISLCTITQQPAAGGTGTVQWTLTGTLVSGASGSVSYTVQVQN